MSKITKSIIPISSIFLIVVINLIFTKFPLLNLLGYESSAVNGIIFYFISGIYQFYLSINFANFSIPKISKPKYFYPIIIILPLIILIISTILCQKCPISNGIYFYLILAIPSILVGAAIAELAIYISNKFKFIIFAIISIILLLGFIPELYFNPQIYFFNPIFGYYPGVIYDQNIQISDKLILYRSITIIVSLTILIVLKFKDNFNYKSQLYVIIIIMLLYLTSDFTKPFFKFSTNLSRIENELQGKFENDNLLIFFPKSINDKEKKILIAEHFYFLEKNNRLLGINFDEKVTSIIFKSGAQKKKLFGSQFADVTKPWLNQFYINFDNYKNSLNHELLHVFSKKFGKGFFNLPTNYNPGLIEGFATAFDNNFDEFDIDYFAFLGYNNNYKISLENLFTNFSFFSNVSSLSYIYAGSFIKFLSKKYSTEKVLEFYANPDFEFVFKKNIQTLENEYFNYLENLNFDVNIHKANLYFGRIPLVKQFCARAMEKDLQNAWEYFHSNNFEESEKLFREIFNYSDSYAALNGIVQNKIKSQNFASAIQLLENEKPNFQKSSYYYNIEYLLAFLYGKTKNINSAIANYDSLILQNVSEFYTNSSVVYKTIAKNDSSVFNKFLDEEFSRKKIIKSFLSKNDDKIYQYYIDRYLLENIDTLDNSELENEMSEIEKSLKRFKPSSDLYFLISKYFYKNLNFHKAIEYSNLALINAKKEKKEILEIFIHKMNWMKNNIYILESYEF
ncbi:MAG: hypothetical protein IPH62_15015 [Ignavibacteriae bacterium]|nr:hypothetical protein [Ignavibacteriota bacterium]